jgi:uncharacterized membrane protein YtjA (UPF0391 family)
MRNAIDEHTALDRDFAVARRVNVKERSNRHRFKEEAMLHLAIVFAVIAIIAGALGFGGVAGASAGIAKIFFMIFLVLLVLALLGLVLGFNIAV